MARIKCMLCEVYLGSMKEIDIHYAERHPYAALFTPDAQQRLMEARDDD